MYPRTLTPEQTADQQGFLAKVFNWMGLGLAITAIVGVVFARSDAALALYENPMLLIGLIVAELGLVWYMNARIMHISSLTATLLFALYAFLNGVTLSGIFLIYTGGSIAATFVVTAGMFFAMAAYGMTTKKDLSSWGSLLFMALIGLVLGGLVNAFLHSDGFSLVLSFVGVIVFVGLTAYDVQKLKNLHASMANDGDAESRIAVLGALVLYLDFINLFLSLLRILGRRR